MRICLSRLLLLAVLFFGGYNYPGMAWAVENWGVNIANVIGMAVLFIKIMWIYFLLSCGFVGRFQDLDTIN